MSRRRQVPPCLWQEQQKGEEDDTLGLGNHPADPVRPLSFTAKCRPLKQELLGELRAAFWAEELKAGNWSAFTPTLGSCRGFLPGEQMHTCRLGNEEEGGRRDGRDRKGERQLWTTTLVLYFKPVAASFSSFTSEILLTSFARCFATGNRVLCEHRVLILPGRPSAVEKKICRKQNFKGSHKRKKNPKTIRKKLCWTK